MAAPERRICWIRSGDKLRPHFLFLPRKNAYSVEAAYEHARVQSDGQYSPHTAFRSLTDDGAAVRFVNEFGPLELLNEAQPRQRLEVEDLIDFGVVEESCSAPEPRSVCIWVDLEDFWQKHRRFVSVVKLWELRESYEAMVYALSELSALRVWPPIGAWRHGERYSPASAFPWLDGEFHLWFRKANPTRVMAASAAIIQAELNLWCYEMRVRWTCPEPSRLQFQIVPFADSLWSAMWHLFARDMSGLGWRICPHCSKLFYPKRKDSYFCDPKYQKLHAANRWWREHKDVELAKRRKARVKEGFGANTARKGE